MLNIVFKGKYKDDYQMKGNRRLPKKATAFKESENSVVKIAAMIIPLIMLIGGMQVLTKQNPDGKFKVTIAFGIAFVIMLVLAKLLTYVHEIIHAALYPKDSVKEIWSEEKKNTKYVYCTAKVSKSRFIAICLAPAIILSIIPYIIMLVTAASIPDYIAECILILVCMMMLLSAGDLFNAYNAAVQVPKNAKVFNYGLKSYWIEE